MNISRGTNDVLSDLFVEVSGFLVVSVPGYVMAHEWLRLTATIFFCILTTRIAIFIRNKTYDKSE